MRLVSWFERNKQTKKPSQIFYSCKRKWGKKEVHSFAGDLAYVAGHLWKDLLPQISFFSKWKPKIVSHFISISSTALKPADLSPASVRGVRKAQRSNRELWTTSWPINTQAEFQWALPSQAGCSLKQLTDGYKTLYTISPAVNTDPVKAFRKLFKIETKKKKKPFKKLPFAANFGLIS